MLRWGDHDPLRRHSRNAHRGDASRGGAHPSGEKCAMPARPHAERRLLHAPPPHSPGSHPKAQAMPERIRAERKRLHRHSPALTRVAMQAHSAIECAVRDNPIAAGRYRRKDLHMGVSGVQLHRASRRARRRRRCGAGLVAFGRRSGARPTFRICQAPIPAAASGVPSSSSASSGVLALVRWLD